MLPVVGVHHVSLSVTDRRASTAWYSAVLGFEVHSDASGPTFERTRLRHPGCGLTLTLTEHHGAPRVAFSELGPGLDHLALELPGLDDVHACRTRFEELGVVHSDVDVRGEPPRRVAILAFRDPDGIQLELFAREESDGG